MPRLYVAILGADESATDTNLRDAYTAGAWLANRHVIVVTGGLGGVMGAAADGVASVGGIVIGLLPSLDRSAAHPSVTIAIPTGLGELRNGLVVRSADSVLAIGGSWGTLSEIALAMRTGVPLVTVGSPIPAGLSVSAAATVEEALPLVLAAAERGR
ncbi:hypothetical protein BH18ACT8_BH18ACT8_10100 [soil metagenome]